MKPGENEKSFDRIRSRFRQEINATEKFIARQFANPSGFFGRNFIVRALTKANLPMNRLTLAQLSPATQDRILEVGFGGGDLLEQILAMRVCAHVAGIDRSRDMVRVAKRRLRRHIRARTLEVRVGDVTALPYANGAFTKLCTVNTLYFWEDPGAALAECRRVLAKDGRLIVCFNSKEDLEKWPPHKHGFRVYETSEVVSLLQRAGFSGIAVVSATDAEVGTYYSVTATA